jgi:hypothetical protein
MTPTQQKAMEMALEYLEAVALGAKVDAIRKALRAALAEQAGSEDKDVPEARFGNMAPLSDEPNWRHPKIQGLIGSEARLRIQIDLIWRILEDPNQEFGPSDMEYWDTLHDKLKSTLTAHGIKGD